MCKLRDTVKANICVAVSVLDCVLCMQRDSQCGRHKNKYAIAVHRFTIIWMVFIVFFAIQRLVSANTVFHFGVPYLCVSLYWLAFCIKT